jgi:hypothetical protein
MVALSFKPRFIEPYAAGTKGGTIRAPRKGREIIRPGVKLQLFTGMRTKYCRRFGEETCISFRPIYLLFKKRPRIVVPGDATTLIGRADLDRFAVFDGFENFDDMEAFWQANHAVAEFIGTWTQWREFEL